MENYEKYYEEWSKGEGVKFEVKDYGFKDLIVDLKKINSRERDYENFRKRYKKFCPDIISFPE